MLAQFKIGDKIRHPVLLKVQKIGTSSTGGMFARGSIQDTSGAMNFISFEPRVAEFLKDFSAPSVIVVYGVIDSNKYAADGSLQIVISRAEEPGDSEDLSHLLPYTPKNIEQYKSKLSELINSLIRPPIKKLAEDILSGEQYQRFVRNPAAMRFHHAYIGGLLEHSVDVATLAQSIAEQTSGVDMDLIIVGALMHDIGKIHEILPEIGFNYTEQGRLLGHIAMGAMLVDRAAGAIEGFSEHDRQHLLHILLSHHGSPEKGSPVVCATKESVIVHYADELNSILNQFDATPEKEDWQYNKMLGRHIYVPGQKP